MVLLGIHLQTASQCLCTLRAESRRARLERRSIGRHSLGEGCLSPRHELRPEPCSPWRLLPSLLGREWGHEQLSACRGLALDRQHGLVPEPGAGGAESR